MEVRRLAVLGTGLIGASVGLAAKRAGVGSVVGYDFVEATAEAARERGAIDSIAMVAESTTADTAEMSAASQEMADTMAQMRARAVTLATTADQLRNLVDQFQLVSTEPVTRRALRKAS